MTVTSHQKVNAPFSVARASDHEKPYQQKRRKKPRSESLSISDSPPYLQIVSVPIDQRVDPERNSYILVIQPVDVRAAGGQWSAEEAYQILKVTRRWDFSLDEDGKPKCLEEFEALLDSICNKGGAA